MKKIVLLTLLFFTPLVTYGEIINVTCIVKYQGGKDAEWNFTFLTPPNERVSKVLLNGKPIEFKRAGDTSEVRNLRVEKSKITFSNINTETYNPPQTYQGQTYESSEINWDFDISRVTGKFSLTEHRNGLQKAVSPNSSTAYGQCQPTSQKF